MIRACSILPFTALQPGGPDICQGLPVTAPQEPLVNVVARNMLYFNWELPSASVAQLESALQLVDRGFRIAPIEIIRGEAPKPYLSLNYYATTIAGVLTYRTEWSTYVVRNGDPRPRFMVIDAQSSEAGADPTSPGFIKPATTVRYTIDGRQVQVSSPDFQASFAMPASGKTVKIGRPTTAQEAQPTPTETSTSVVITTSTSTHTPLLTSTSTPQPHTSLINYGPDDFPSDINPLTGREVAEPSLLQFPAMLVSISNSPFSARPQAGPGFAPWVFELFIGEGATRFMNVFYGDLPRDVPNVTGECKVRDEKIRPSGDWIGNRVWLDENENGVQDEWEMGVGGVCVHLLDGTSREVLQETSTDSNGYYAFENPKTEVIIQFVKPSAYQFTPAPCASR